MERRPENGPVGGEGAPEGLMSSPQSRMRGINRQIAARLRDIPEQFNDLNQQLVTITRERPLAALGVACAAGYVLGRLLRRVV